MFEFISDIKTLLSWLQIGSTILNTLPQSQLERFEHLKGLWSQHFTEAFPESEVCDNIDDESALKRIYTQTNLELVEKEVQKILDDKYLSRHRIQTPLDDIIGVCKNFKSAPKPISTSTIRLYSKFLNTSKLTTLAFVVACHQDNDLFLDMDSEALSYMKGRPCRARDIEPIKQFPKIFRGFNSMPHVLISHKDLRLYSPKMCLASLPITGILAPIPTTSLMEQSALCVSPQGLCRIIQTTESSMTITREFDLDTEGDIHWVDVRKLNKGYVLYWGGTDSMRTQELWSFCVVLDKNLEFEEIDAVDADSSIDKMQADIMRGHDFMVHGNVLSLLRQHTEKDRKFIPKSTILFDAHEVLCTDLDLVDIWGSPQQFVSLDINGTLRLNTEVIAKLDLDIYGDANMCVLYAHSH